MNKSFMFKIILILCFLSLFVMAVAACNASGTEEDSTIPNLSDSFGFFIAVDTDRKAEEADGRLNGVAVGFIDGACVNSDRIRDEMFENAKFWRLLMEQNNFYCRLAGASLGYDAENGIISFQWAWPLVDINAARLENMLLNYAKGLEHMQTLVHQGVQEQHNEAQSFAEASLIRG